MKTKTLLFPASAFLEALELAKEQNQRFQVERTGYTAKIITEGGSWMFAEGLINPRLFALLRKLRAEVSEHDLPNIGPESAVYHQFSAIKSRKELPPKAWSVDLTSAYLNALRHLDLISRNLFAELSELPKGDRLRVVGMLATTKTRFQYQEGRPVKMSQEPSPTRGAFFAACRAVGELMSEVCTHPAFLFFWVDGAYFDREVPDVVEFFEGRGYPCKVETLEKLRWSKNRKFLFYLKNGEQKYLPVPSPKMPAPAWIENLLNNPTP